MSERLSFGQGAPCHAVYFYPSADELTRRVTRFVADGFSQHEPAFVIARAGILRDIVPALDGLGFDTAAAEREARLFLLDSDLTLESVLVDGRVDPVRARHLVEGMFDRLPDAFRGRPARLFGEVSGKLWHSGRYIEAMQLEDLGNLWNTRSGLTTLCSYSLNDSDRSSQDAVCAFHTHQLSQAGQFEAIN